MNSLIERGSKVIKTSTRYMVFIGGVARGENPEASPVELDALLHWLAGRRNERANSIKTAFEMHGVSGAAARKYTLSYLDHVLFFDNNDPYRMLGVETGADPETIRTKHKELLQIFHPDRHARNRDWFTARTEQLNAAYAGLKVQDRKQAREKGPPLDRGRRNNGKEPADSVSMRRGRATSEGRTALRRNLRRILGDSARLERHIYVVLIVILSALLASLYLAQPAYGGLRDWGRWVISPEYGSLGRAHSSVETA